MIHQLTVQETGLTGKEQTGSTGSNRIKKKKKIRKK